MKKTRRRLDSSKCEPQKDQLQILTVRQCRVGGHDVRARLMKGARNEGEDERRGRNFM